MLKNYLFCPKQGQMVPKTFCRVCMDDCPQRIDNDHSGLQEATVDKGRAGEGGSGQGGSGQEAKEE